jgi:hypothetical protein
MKCIGVAQSGLLPADLIYQGLIIIIPTDYPKRIIRISRVNKISSIDFISYVMVGSAGF